MSQIAHNLRMGQLIRKSIHTTVLFACLLPALPVSVIRAEVGAMGSNPRSSDRAMEKPGHEGKVPTKNCPVLEFRAGLALVSLKPAAKVHVQAPMEVLATQADHIPSIRLFKNPNNPRTLGPPLSFLRFLRI